MVNGFLIRMGEEVGSTVEPFTGIRAHVVQTSFKPAPDRTERG